MKKNVDIHPLPYAAGEVYFNKIKDCSRPVWLDSGKPKTTQGRFDFIAANPTTTLDTTGPLTLWQSTDKHCHSTADPFELIQKALGAVSATHTDLPFTGGAIGYFAYDLGRRFERLPSEAARDIPMPDMSIGIYPWVIAIDHEQKHAFFCYHADKLSADSNIEAIYQHLQETQAPSVDTEFAFTRPFVSNMTFEQYATGFQKVKEYIFAGDCYQVNLAQRFTAGVTGSSLAAYLVARERNPAPFGAYIKTPFGAILSTSPERFLKIKDGVVETKPIKGTRPRGKTQAEDKAQAATLQASEKDQAENLMIVDLVRNDLGRTCAVGSVKVPKLFALESFTTVHHLVSTVTAKLAEGKHALDCLRGAFPGGSITGAPKIRAMEISETCEPHRRGAYCGSIGYIGFDGAMDTNIAIRTMTWENGRLHCAAGGGLVADSILEEEYQETFHKVRSLLQFGEDYLKEEI